MNTLKVTWFAEAWEDYQYWQTQDRKTLVKINKLIKDIQRNGNEGIGEPEPLKHEFSGFWNRKIDKTNRFVYKINDRIVEILSCKGYIKGISKNPNWGFLEIA